MELMELTNGCVCCQIGDDLSAALIRVLESPRPFDAVVIEASGVSDPWRIAQLGRADPGLALDGIVVLIDASAAQSQWRDPLLADTFERQLKAADLIVVNKRELIEDDAREPLRQWIESIAGPVPRFETTQAEVPLAMLSGIAMPLATEVHRCDEADCEHDHAHPHPHEHASPDHGNAFETWSCRPDRVFDPAALRAWLRDTPPGLLRLKGVLRTAEPDGGSAWSELQFAGRHGALRRAAEPQGGAALVAIGLSGRLPTAQLAGYFEH